jgi:hypothetical protein
VGMVNEPGRPGLKCDLHVEWIVEDSCKEVARTLKEILRVGSASELNRIAH